MDKTFLWWKTLWSSHPQPQAVSMHGDAAGVALQQLVAAAAVAQVRLQSVLLGCVAATWLGLVAVVVIPRSFWIACSCAVFQLHIAHCPAALCWLVMLYQSNTTNMPRKTPFTPPTHHHFSPPPFDTNLHRSQLAGTNAGMGTGAQQWCSVFHPVPHALAAAVRGVGDNFVWSFSGCCGPHNRSRQGRLSVGQQGS